MGIPIGWGSTIHSVRDRHVHLRQVGGLSASITTTAEDEQQTWADRSTLGLTRTTFLRFFIDLDSSTWRLMTTIGDLLDAETIF